ncbi:DUF2637 domain-containing protein [Amycolatopsis thermophila]|uniref:DUF2637 domain-containing protein n=1 Tax=Amycolatopsis thermophila TaxID=206084 RepID=A0ABU0EY92_9PSEU|nr:DUF2637 domain-containing protein [Amycolatopsis thermophila]MDQ0380281.1 hypothetical protein [Amycolatopsis thermophila]
MSKVDSLKGTGTRLVEVVRVLVTVVLGGIGAAAGFTHTHDWAVHHGQTGWLAWADAVVIEGIAIVAGFEVRRDHHAGNTRRITFPMVVLVAGFGIQMTAQVALAEPTPGGWLLAAMPALGFLVVVKLLMRRTPAPAATSTPAEPPATPLPETTTAPVPTTTPAPPPRPLPPPARGSTLAKLPAGLRESVTRTTATAHSAGRPVTADDLSGAVKLPDAMLTALLDELNTSVNHHPVTT